MPPHDKVCQMIWNMSFPDIETQFDNLEFLEQVCFRMKIHLIEGPI